jgi:hypothetical protein
MPEHLEAGVSSSPPLSDAVTRDCRSHEKKSFGSSLNHSPSNYYDPGNDINNNIRTDPPTDSDFFLTLFDYLPTIS